MIHENRRDTRELALLDGGPRSPMWYAMDNCLSFYSSSAADFPPPADAEPGPRPSPDSGSMRPAARPVLLWRRSR